MKKPLRLSAATEIGIADGTAGTATITAGRSRLFAVVAGDPSSACLVSVAAGKPDVSLRDVTLTQDPGLTLSGACTTNGALNLRRVHVTGFRAGGVVATALPGSGCDHEADVNDSTTLRVLASLVDGNHSAGKGAGISSEGSGATVYVQHSAIVNNASDNDGGGIYLGGGWATNIIHASTISGNTTSGVGGGVLVRFAPMTITYVHIFSSTIANNTAAGTGGGIQFEPADQEGTQDVWVYASVVAGTSPCRPSSNGTSTRNGSSPTPRWPAPAPSTASTGPSSMLRPGIPRPRPTWGGVHLSTFATRSWARSRRWAAKATCPCIPCSPAAPPIDAGGGQHPARPAARSLDRQRRYGHARHLDAVRSRSVDGDGDGTAVRDLGAIEKNDRWQAELLAARAKGPSPHTDGVTIPGGWDRGAGTDLRRHERPTNEFVTYALSESGSRAVTT